MDLHLYTHQQRSCQRKTFVGITITSQNAQGESQRYSNEKY